MKHLIKDCLDDFTQILYIFLNTKYQETVQAFFITDRKCCLQRYYLS